MSDLTVQDVYKVVLELDARLKPLEEIQRLQAEKVKKVNSQDYEGAQLMQEAMNGLFSSFFSPACKMGPKTSEKPVDPQAEVEHNESDVIDELEAQLKKKDDEYDRLKEHNLELVRERDKAVEALKITRLHHVEELADKDKRIEQLLALHNNVTSHIVITPNGVALPCSVYVKELVNTLEQRIKDSRKEATFNTLKPLI